MCMHCVHIYIDVQVWIVDNTFAQVCIIILQAYAYNYTSDLHWVYSYYNVLYFQSFVHLYQPKFIVHVCIQKCSLSSNLGHAATRYELEGSLREAPLSLASTWKQSPLHSRKQVSFQ